MPSSAVASIESLESRCLLASVSVNPGTVIRNVDPKWLGFNTAPWDGQLSTGATQTLVNAINPGAIRMGGGSYVDDTWRFNLNNQSQTMGQQANFTANHNAVGMVTVNYGSGSPQESAALLAYLNGDASNTFTIGLGEQWNGSSWVDVDWKSVNYWAGLRAAAPINGNPDGLNFLRLNHPAPYDFTYWDIGNEVYGSWEVDHHGGTNDHLPMPSGLSRAAHDPATIVSFAKQFQTLSLSIDPTISVGFDSQNTDPTQFGNWVANVVTQANSSHQNLNLGFVSDHLYMQDAGGESDSFLLNTIAQPMVPIPANPKNWVQRAQKYRSIINANYGAGAANVELLSTEHNSISSNPRKQMTSLVNGVFLADSIGSIMQTEFNSLMMWDLHNSFTSGSNITTLYGWRLGGDYGLLGTNGTAPQAGVNTPFPDYFAEQLASKIVIAGGQVIQVVSNDANIGAYAVKEADGHVRLLVVNRSKNGLNNDTTGTPALISTTFNFSGFTPAAQAQMWQFGTVEDNAAKVNGQTSLTLTNPTLAVNGASFTMSFPSLSMSIIDLTPVAFASINNRVLTVSDTNTSDALSLAFTATSVTVGLNGDTLPFNLSDFDSVIVNASAGDDTLAVSAPGAITRPIDFVGGTGANALTLASGSMSIASDLGASNTTTGVTVASGASLAFASTQHLSNLSVSGTASLIASGSSRVVVHGLSIPSGGTLDLNDNDLILDYTGASPLAAVQQLINLARAGGAWTGTGLTSSTARDNVNHNTTLGAMEASDYPGGSTFDGEPLDATAVLVKYTYYGDTDFNGRVNFDDYVRTDNGFNNNLSGWLNGDFDGNGQVNFDDYVLIDLAFNTQGAALGRALRRGAAAGSLPRTM
jgi:hypothetical protein